MERLRLRADERKYRVQVKNLLLNMTFNVAMFRVTNVV